MGIAVTKPAKSGVCVPSIPIVSRRREWLDAKEMEELTNYTIISHYCLGNAGCLTTMSNRSSTRKQCFVHYANHMTKEMGTRAVKSGREQSAYGCECTD